MDEWLEEIEATLQLTLNDEQRAVIDHAFGPALVLACPGSGKTTTLILRIGALLARNVEPKRILAITFSKQAALELQERFRSFFPQSEMPLFSTIHRLAFYMTREALAEQRIPYTFLESANSPKSKRELLQEMYRRVTNDYLQDDRLKELETFISEMKNKMIPLNEWTRQEPFREAGKIGRLYEEWKISDPTHRWIDFDDMLTIAEEALRTSAQFRMRHASRYDFILTDESQDTSLVQHRLIEQLASVHHNLFIVADDDQSIYTWRGASPDYLLQFEQRYPESVVYYLTTNYRSGEAIIDAANGLIRRNQNRYEKEMHAGAPHRSRIIIQSFHDTYEQMNYVASELVKESELGEVAVLFRNHFSSTMYASELHRRGVPFYMKDADYYFFSHWLVRDVLSFMQLIDEPNNSRAFRQIAFKLELYLSRKMLEAFDAYEGDETNVFDRFIASNPSLRSYQKDGLLQIKESYASLQGATPSSILETIRHEFQYEEAIRNRAETFGHRIDYLLDMYETLEAIARDKETVEQFFIALEELKQVMQDAKKERTGDVVTLSTIHSAKGLEWRRVFMIDLQQGILPTEEDESSIDKLEEARRLFYVGMTRAKERLELLSVKEAKGKKREESRFISEVRYDQLPEKERFDREKQRTKIVRRTRMKKKETMPLEEQPFTENMSVTHRVFGEGVITSIIDTTVFVRFKDRERKFDLPTVIQYEMLQLNEEKS